MDVRTYTFAGWSRRHGDLRLRFTNDRNRTRVLERAGHKDVNLFELPSSMDREAAARWVSRQRGTPAEVRTLVKALIAELRVQNETAEPDDQPGNGNDPDQGNPPVETKSPRQAA